MGAQYRMPGSALHVQNNIIYIMVIGKAIALPIIFRSTFFNEFFRLAYYAGVRDDDDYPDGSILKTGFLISSRLRRTMKFFFNFSF